MAWRPGACRAAPCSFVATHGGGDYVVIDQGASATGQARRDVTWDAEGIARIESGERMALANPRGAAIGHREVHVTLERTAPPAGLAHARLRGTRVAVSALRGDAARRGLEQRVAGLTIEQVLADLALAVGGRLPDHDRWLWRATGLLQLDPTAATSLADACLDGRLEGESRRVALELLANVGNPASQAGLRRVLADPEVVAGEDYPRLVQRAVLLRDPEDETIAFLTGQGEALQGASSRASFVAAGGAIGHARSGDQARGQEAVGRMQQALGTASDPADRRALVMALGNAAAAEAQSDLLEAARDNDADLRRTAARALAHLEDDESAGQLAAMVQDPDPLVQRAAHDALSENHPTGAQLAGVAGFVAELPQPTRVAVVTLLERLLRQPESAPLRAAMLEVVNALRPTSLPDDAAHRLMALDRALRGTRAR